MLDTSRKLILTRHAKSRAEQFRLTIPKVYWLFWHSGESEAPPGVDKYRREGENEGVFYRRSGTIVMTVREIVDQFTGKPAYLMITLFDQQLYLGASQLDYSESRVGTL